MADDKPPVDTMNKFLVSRAGGDPGDFVFLRPIPQRISQADAYLLAAFLVAMSDDDDEFKRVLQAVCNT